MCYIVDALNVVELDKVNENLNQAHQTEPKKRGRKRKPPVEPVLTETDESESKEEPNRLLQIESNRKRLRSANLVRQDKNREKIVSDYEYL